MTVSTAKPERNWLGWSAQCGAGSPENRTNPAAEANNHVQFALQTPEPPNSGDMNLDPCAKWLQNELADVLLGECRLNESNSPRKEKTMGDCTSSAEFTGPQMGSNRKNVQVNSKMGGGGLLVNGTKNDVETYGEDAAGKKSATKIADSVIPSGTQYDAAVQHGANWEKTYIRVKCADKSWSNWILVKK